MRAPPQNAHAAPGSPRVVQAGAVSLRSARRPLDADPVHGANLRRSGSAVTFHRQPRNERIAQ